VSIRDLLKSFQP